MIRLYLHPDLCKAEGEPEVKKVAPGVAAGIPKPEMRVRQTTHKRTAGEQRRVGREERAYAQKVTDKPTYKCPHCESMVRPPRSKEGGGEHPAQQITKQGKMMTLPEGTLQPEHLPTKSRTGRRVSGACPGCHEQRKPKQIARTVGKTPEEAAAKMEAKMGKAIDMFNDMIFDAMASQAGPAPINKGIRLLLAL